MASAPREAPDVALLACPEYDRGLVEEKVARAFELLGGPGAFVSAGETVFVKVNAVVPLDPGRCATTHPEVVRAVVLQLEKAGGRVVIGDSPGGPYNRPALKRAYARTGIARVAGETGAGLNYDLGEVRVSLPGGKAARNLVLCRPMVEADRLVSVGKAKTHAFMGFTCAIKNMYGTVPGMEKFTYHSRFRDERDFADLVVDVALAAGADLHVVDGVWGMEGNGSVWGIPRRLGFVAAGRDPFALDCAVEDLVGLKRGFNRPLAAAVGRGLFHGDPARISLAGDDPASIRTGGLVLPRGKATVRRLPGVLMKAYSSVMAVRPYPDPRRCTGCGKCAQICPAGAVTMSGGTAEIDRSLCIECYCCQELCEHDGIDLERPLAARVRGLSR